MGSVTSSSSWGLMRWGLKPARLAHTARARPALLAAIIRGGLVGVLFFARDKVPGDIGSVLEVEIEGIRGLAHTPKHLVLGFDFNVA